MQALWGTLFTNVDVEMAVATGAWRGGPRARTLGRGGPVFAWDPQAALAGREEHVSDVEAADLPDAKAGVEGQERNHGVPGGAASAPPPADTG